MPRFLIILSIAAVIAGGMISADCIERDEPIRINSLKLIGEYDLKHRQSFKGTTVGGLSGIDYDPKNNLYYIISDDRSAINPARFYTANIYLTAQGIDSVRFVDVYPLLNAKGTPYPDAKTDAWHAPDPESIRYNPPTKQLVWTSEGERIIKTHGSVMQDPAINIVSTVGHYIDSIPIPAATHMNPVEKGVRQNGGFEGLTLTPDHKSMFVSLELPLYEDGPEPSTTKTNSFARIFRYDIETKLNTAQFAYPLEPVAFPPATATSFKVNGISEILAPSDNELIVIERSFSTGRPACTIKLFLTDLSNADNIQSVISLKESPPAKVASKKLLLNMDDLGIYVDNVEGITFGPDLPNGHRTLVLVADDNFQSLELTQFFLFEIL